MYWIVINDWLKVSFRLVYELYHPSVAMETVQVNGIKSITLITDLFAAICYNTYSKSCLAGTYDSMYRRIFFFFFFFYKILQDFLKHFGEKKLCKTDQYIQSYIPRWHSQRGSTSLPGWWTRGWGVETGEGEAGGGAVGGRELTHDKLNKTV